MSSGGNGPKRKKLLIAVLTILGAFVIVGGGTTYYAGTNDFCGSCHQMKTRYALWEKSSHNEVNCITCHSEPGFVGELKAHVDGLNYLKSYIKGRTTHISIFATRRNPARLRSCLHCHPAETLGEQTEALRVYHFSHVVKDELLCTDCHEDMIHGSHSLEIKKTLPKEENCIACHLREGARLDCQTCHIRKVNPGERQLFLLEALQDTGIGPEEDP